MNILDLRSELKKLINEYPTSFNVKLDSSLDANGEDEEYIEIYNNKTDCCICWFFKSGDFFDIHIPRLILQVEEKDKELMKKVIDFYYSNVVDYQ